LAEEIRIGEIVCVADDPYEASDDPRDEATEAAFGQVQTVMDAGSHAVMPTHRRAIG